MAVYPEKPCSPVRLPASRKLDGSQPPDARPGAIDLGCFVFPESRTEQNLPSDATAYALASRDVDLRNRLTAILLKQADDVCTSEKALLLKRQAEANGWLSIATTGLSTVSTIVTGELAKSILSGGAALTSGSRDHINTHVYRNQIIQTVTKAIDTERVRLLQIIVPHLEFAIEKYSVDDMIREVNNYHQACSFSLGLQLVMDSVEKRAEFDKISKVQDIDGQLSALMRDQTILAKATQQAEYDDLAVIIKKLRDERIRLMTGVKVD